ncbi:hypothetical protein HGB24_00480 [Candidatus Saccharibacteria bacterium]|nr:hypothetical protein [Candidatus Saccharibacteria bacterium]
MDQDDNRIQNSYDKNRGSFLNDAEKAVNGGATSNAKNIDGLSDNEAGASDDNFIYNNTRGNKKRSPSGGLTGLIKKKGPIVAILSTLGVGGIISMALLSPSALISQFKEVMLEKFNYQSISAEKMSISLLEHKLKATKGICGSKITIACRLSTITEQEMKNYSDAGIKVKTTKTTITGRYVPESFEFNNKMITAKNFRSEIRGNLEFSSAMRKVYSARSSGFFDKVSKNVFSRLKVSQAKADLDGETDSDKLKKIQDSTKNGYDGNDSDIKKVTTDDIDPDTKEKYTPEKVAEVNNKIEKAIDTTNDLAKGADDVASSGKKVGTAALEAGGKIANVFKITGLADDACTLYRTIQSIGYAAKMYRAAQMARYAMLFFNVADQIKAGVANPKDVEYLGKVLTAESTTIDGKTVKIEPAGNSVGYKYAAYGEYNTSKYSSQFMSGGGFSGSLTGITNRVNAFLGGGNKAKTTCGVLANPLVGAGSIIAGVAMFFLPGGAVAMTLKDIAQGAAGVAFAAAEFILPAMLQDIVAGVLVDESTVGELAGEAISSGAAVLMGNLAKSGGNAPLSPDQAKEYSEIAREINAQYAAEDRLAYSPLDPSNSNTFAGQIVSVLTPFASKISTLSGTISSIASIVSSSFSSLFSNRVFAATESYDYKSCEDVDYSDPNSDGDDSDRIATDIYCNPVYGLVYDFDKSPDQILSKMDGQIDDDGSAIPGSKYEEIVNNCINRSTPIGSVDSDGKISDGSECILSDSNKDFYAYNILQRVQNTREELNTPSENTDSDTTSFNLIEMLSIQ